MTSSTESGSGGRSSWSLFDASPSGVCVTGPSGAILYANPKLHRMLGYADGDLVGRDLSVLDAHGTVPMPAPMEEGIDTDVQERRYCRADGDCIWVQESVSSFRGEDGAAHQLRIVTDLSHHRVVESKLRDQLLMKDVLFETLPVPVFLIDRDGRYVDCNDAFERYTGLDRQAVLRQTGFAVMDEEIAKAHAERDRDLLIHWGRQSYDEQVPHADGTPRRARLSKAVYCDSDGEFGGIVGIIHDIYEGQPDEARLQTILEHSPVGVSMSRRDNGVIIFANSRFCDLIGLPRERIVGSRARDYYVDESQRRRVIEELQETGGVLNMEVQFRRADGSPFWSLFSLNQATIHGLPVNLAWIFDYTERRNMEESLRDMASKDPLTGIYNRRSFMDLARQQMARANRFNEPMSMLVLDVDHFKLINDTYGHATGDDALRMVASACSSMLREYDILGRLGGE